MKRRWADVLLVAGIATLLGLLFAAQLYVTHVQSKRPVVLTQILASALPFWYLWALLVPGIALLARRVPIDRSRLLQGVAIHLPAAALISALHQGLYILQGCLWRPRDRPCHFLTDFSQNVFSFYFMVGLIVYFAIVFGTQAVDYARRFRDSQLRASRLEAELSTARLHALRAQLQPHFLFNTLHAISALIARDPDAADRMIADLSDLLRLSLEDVDVVEVTVRRELEIVERYLSIERARFADRLTVNFSIEPETLDARVPSLILQPLVENAVAARSLTPSGAGLDRDSFRSRGRQAFSRRSRRRPGANQSGVGRPPGRDRLSGDSGAARTSLRRGSIISVRCRIRRSLLRRRVDPDERGRMKATIRAVIADDEPLARERLRNLLGHDAEIEIVAEASDGKAAVKAIERTEPDLLFLDIRMPGLDGFGVLDSLRLARPPVVVFVTAYDRYAVKAFEIHALDYLLKPFHRARFEETLRRAKTAVRRGAADHLTRVLGWVEDSRPEPRRARRFLVKTSGRVLFVAADDIDWIEAAGNYVRCTLEARPT